MTLQRILSAALTRVCAASCVSRDDRGLPRPCTLRVPAQHHLSAYRRSEGRCAQHRRQSDPSNPLHIDKLANDGVRFTEAHVVAPVCMPSRTSFMNGQYERVHQIGFSSPNVLSDAQWDQTYSALLRHQGYHVGFVGKIGLQQYSFRGKPLEKFDFWRGHDDWARFWPKEFEHLAIYHDAEAEIVTPIMSDSIERFLDDAPADKPFMLSVSFSAPHGSISGSMLYPEEDGATRMTKPANSHPKLDQHPTYGSLYRDANLQPPSTFEDDTAKHIPLDVHPREGRMNTYSYSYLGPDVLREHQVRYYQLIHGVDDAVGQLRESLQRRGIADNTVIVFSSDHGLLMGEYAMGGKSLLYDLTTRVAPDCLRSARTGGLARNDGRRTGAQHRRSRNHGRPWRSRRAK